MRPYENVSDDDLRSILEALELVGGDGPDALVETRVRVEIDLRAAIGEVDPYSLLSVLDLRVIADATAAQLSMSYTRVYNRAVAALERREGTA